MVDSGCSFLTLPNQGVLCSWETRDSIFRDRAIYTSYFEPADTVLVTTFMPCEQISWQKKKAYGDGYTNLQSLTQKELPPKEQEWGTLISSNMCPSPTSAFTPPVSPLRVFLITLANAAKHGCFFHVEHSSKYKGCEDLTVTDFPRYLQQNCWRFLRLHQAPLRTFHCRGRAYSTSAFFWSYLKKEWKPNRKSSVLGANKQSRRQRVIALSLST